MLATIAPPTVTLPSGTSQTSLNVTFDRASRRDAPGGQIVVSEGRTVVGNGFLTVSVRTPPGPPWLLYTGLALLLVVAVLGFVLWRRACKRAGVPGRPIHDLRRTAVRNFERAGVPRSVAMKLAGHKTDSIYCPCAIVSEADLAEAVGKVAALSEGASGSRR